MKIGTDQIFTKESANALLPLIIKITKKYEDSTQVLMNTMVPVEDHHNVGKAIDDQIYAQIEEWKGKMTKLGVRTNGLWLVDFDSGDGYFCWKYPEPEILFWHEYSESFSGRKAI